MVTDVTPVGASGDEIVYRPPIGRLVSLERDVPHMVEALEESAFLLTIAWRGRHDDTAQRGEDSA